MKLKKRKNRKKTERLWGRLLMTLSVFDDMMICQSDDDDHEDNDDYYDDVDDKNLVCFL